MGQRSLGPILRTLEEERERRWERQSRAADLKLEWRALFIQKYLHLLPGDRILEIGAGGGALTERLSRTLRGQNPITSIVFSPALLERARARGIANAVFEPPESLFGQPPAELFDYAIGSGMLWHGRFGEALDRVLALLKPGGQLLFFEPNLRLPARLCNGMSRRRGDLAFDGSPERVVDECARRGLTELELAPHDIVSCKLGYAAMKRLQAKAILVEHMPGVRFACGSMVLSARKAGARARPLPNLAEHPSLFGAVSVVVPAHNEEANIQPLVDSLVAYYGDYLHEIVIVNDNSTDATADAIAEAARRDPRVKAVNRSKPNGVGRALRDGYRATTGRYILSMDCDFVQILPELRGLFDAVADGHAGAIGSRFTHESVLINYPFTKMALNRLCHVLIKAFLLDNVRDISNNLKLYRADILRQLEIESPHFSANLETGLKPMLAGYDIAEVPVSWINRTPQMGSSTFHLKQVGSDYAKALYRCWRGRRTEARGTVQLALRAALSRIAARH